MTIPDSLNRSLFTFLILLTLENLHIMSFSSAKERQLATQRWLTWGITFLLIAFFILAPEQEHTSP